MNKYWHIKVCGNNTFQAALISVVQTIKKICNRYDYGFFCYNVSRIEIMFILKFVIIYDIIIQMFKIRGIYICEINHTHIMIHLI